MFTDHDVCHVMTIPHIIFRLGYDNICSHIKSGGCRGHDHMVVGFTIAYAIGAYCH